MQKKMLYIGVDDTDIIGSVGTGRIARDMGSYLESLGLGHSRGVIRHQLLVDPRIPYTSHNSSKCVLFETGHLPMEIEPDCIKFIREHFQEGSDPGLCITTEQQADSEFLSYGCLAQQEFILKQHAIDLACRLGILLKELGGTGDGIIGALAATALSIGGNDGRYVHLRGIKEIEGLLTVAQIKTRTDTLNVVDENGRSIPETGVVDSMGWLRPSRINGQPILRVRLERDGDGSNIWRPIERKLRTHAKD